MANQDGEELDHIKVKAQKVKTMRLSKEVTLSAEGQDCSKFYIDEQLDDLVLHQNSGFTWFNEDDEPMLGFLNLTASGLTY